MSQTFLTNASTSPWTFPANYLVAGHTVELIGAGGSGAVGTTGAVGTGGAGGGGGGYAKFTYSAGTITPGTTTIPFVVPTGGLGAGNPTIWQTATNGQRVGIGGNASGTTAGAAGGGASSAGTPAITYTTTTTRGGGAGGAGLQNAGGGGGGGAAGPIAAGGVGGTPTGLNGVGGGGANNGATGNAAGGTAIAGGTGSSGAAGSTTGAAGTGNSGGAGCTGSAQNTTGGAGGSGADFDGTHGCGGGGGGCAGWATNTASTQIGGNGGSYGGGGAGCGYTLATSGSTFTPGVGAGGLIVITGGAVTGTLGVTEQLDTLAAAGGPVVGGTLGVTEQLDTLAAAAGGLVVTGTLGVTEQLDTLAAAAGGLVVTGTLGVTEQLDTLAAAGVGGKRRDYSTISIDETAPDRHVRRDGGDYADAFLGLLPQGQAWPRHPESTLVKTVNGLADYWGTVDGRAADLLEIESDPRSTLELLTDWERNWGLPDPCFPDTPNIDARRKMLLLKMTLLGGQSRAFFEWVANFLGFTAVIREWSPFMAGVSQAGDTRDASGIYRWEIGPPEMRFYWQFSVTTAGLIWFRASKGQAGIDHHLTILTPPDLNCLFERWKPAQTEIVFSFSNLNPNDPMAGTP